MTSRELVTEGGEIDRSVRRAELERPVENLASLRNATSTSRRGIAVETWMVFVVMVTSVLVSPLAAQEHAVVDGASHATASEGRWSKQEAKQWYDRQPWLIGCNYVPSTVANDVEMWQAATFDAKTIERELGWARSIGFNSVRVFLNFVAWKADPSGFKSRLNRFLEIATRHEIRVMPILFDDCNFANRVARPGPQPSIVDGVHNSQWVSSPPLAMVTDRHAWPQLKVYTRDIVGAFGSDDRILLWDLYNEPGNSSMGEKSLPLAEAVFGWARQVHPEQPLTIGAWTDFQGKMSQRMFELSDVISFHGYDTLPGIEAKLEICRAFDRPIICTEWLHRQSGNTVESILPLFQRERVGCYNWGLVFGRTQTYMPWGSQPGDPVPELWQHDLFHADGKPFREEEIRLIRQMIRRQ
jgi:hypothetical protein